MKFNKLHIPVLFFSIWNLQNSFAQSSKDACLQEIKNIYQKFSIMGNAGAPKDRTIYYNYSVRTATKDSLTNGIYNSEVSIWARGKNIQIHSGSMEMYQNENDSFVILPKQKQVVRLDPYYKNEKDKDAFNSRSQMIKDTLFALSKVVVCEKRNEKKIVVLEVNEQGREYLNVKRVTFVINTKENEFEEIKVEYEKDNGLMANVVYVDYLFHEINFDCRNKNLNENLARKFLKSPRQPSDSYKGYTLVDNRHKKNREVSKE